MKQVLNNAGVDRTQALFRYVTGQNIPDWNGSSIYLTGDTVIFNNTGWYCIQDNTGKEPDLNGSYWTVYDAVGTGVRNLIIKDAYFIGPPVFYARPTTATAHANWAAYPLVDGDYPISYQPYPTVPGQSPDPVIIFTPFAVEKDKLSYKTGFESSTLSLTLRPREPNTLTQAGGSASPYHSRGPGNSDQGYPAFAQGLQAPAPYSDAYTFVNEAGPVTLYQTMRQSFSQTTDWYLAPVTMYRFFMPTEGDTDTFGGAVMFRGRMSEFNVDREDVKITVSSLMEIFKQKVPTQTIQPGNRWAPFNFNATEDYFGQVSGVHSGGYNWCTLDFGSAPSLTDGTLDEGWALIFHEESEFIGWRHVYTNYGTHIIDASTWSTLLFVEPLPINLGETSVVQVRLWKSSDTTTNPDGPGAGFPYVPQPFTGIT
jgi:hypothetical protein